MSRESSISFSKYSYLMNRIAYWLIVNKKNFKTRNIYGYMGRVLDYRGITELIRKNGTNYKSDNLISEFVECAIYDNKDHSFLPNYVSDQQGTKYYKNCFVSMANRVSAYEVLNARSPAIVYINDPKGNGTTNKSADKTLKSFINVFGSVTDFDSCLAKIKNKGYLYYYNSHYNTEKTITRIKKGQGVNCTDSSQLFYRLALALGYEVQFVHVQCSSGGHIRLRLRHKVNTGGNWINRDPACVLSKNSNSVRCIWCINGKILAYDPAWIFSDLYQ